MLYMFEMFEIIDKKIYNKCLNTDRSAKQSFCSRKIIFRTNLFRKQKKSNRKMRN